jgi:outer membrane protein
MYSTHRFNFHAQSILDVSRVHKGHELRFAAIIPVEFEKNQWALTLGVNYQSQKVLDYYYGVDTDEVADDAFQYTAKSAGVTPMLRLDWQRPVGRHWSWRAVLQYSKLPDAVVASPIIDESFVGTIFVGGVYHF